MIFTSWLISTRSMINSFNFTVSHPRQQSSALLEKLGDVSPKVKKRKYAYITLLMETFLRQQKCLL